MKVVQTELSGITEKNNLPKKKRKNHSKLGKKFVPPDGGYGYFICIAAGFSNFCTFPVLQQFGLLFRERLVTSLQISSSQITTIININQAATSLIGLANGPVFRRFSFRQVAFFGSLIVSIAIFCTSLANSFVAFLIAFSIMYGAGVGLTTSSNSLALNTYFKQKRRIVTGLSWSCTALGPIAFPFIVNFLIPKYGVNGTVLIFSGIAMNAIACALLLQPVLWHVKKPPTSDVEKQTDEQLMVAEIECPFCLSLKQAERKTNSIFSSQYLMNAEIDTPVLPLCNDGWYSSTPTKRSIYSSKMSLTSRRNDIDSKRASNQNLAISKRPSFVNNNFGGISSEKREKRRERLSQKIVENQENNDFVSVIPKNKSFTGSFKNNKTSPATPMASRNSFILPQITENKYMNDNHSLRSLRQQQSFRNRTNTFNVEKQVLNEVLDKLEEYVNQANEKLIKCTCDVVKQQYLLDLRNMPFVVQEDDEDDEMIVENYTLWQKIMIFFDLDLLNDLTYVNIMVGITLANFAELNFSVLTPFVLNEFGLDPKQTAFCMSLLGTADIFCRLFIPFIAGYTKFSNRTFFLIGVLNMAMGRIVLAHFHTYYMALAVAVWVGFGKGLRTVFMALCIPSHVHIDRLPAASGLHLLFSGLFYIFMGPIVGFIRDNSNFTVTLHCLNICTFTTATTWMIEKILLNRRKRNQKRREMEIDGNERE